MLDKETLIKVTNTTNGRVGYIIPDLGNFHRSFMPNETKEVTFEELQKLVFSPGGEVLLRQHLTIENKEALSSLLGEVEPEYFYTKEDVKNLLEKGSLDQFMDFLDFAPEGMINTAKDLAVEIEVNDIRKREAILKKTGFNVTKAIQINHETGINENIESQERTRRRSEPVKYKIAIEK